jgi:hypothetical protein
MLIVVACATGATAQTCGDADGNGSVSVADGVRVLRAAAGLGDCDPRACDADGNGTVSVADAVNVLRAAAGLAATLTCAASPVASFVEAVTTSDGTTATLQVGVAPIPSAGAGTTVGSPQGNTNVIPGGSNTVTVPFDTSAALRTNRFANGAAASAGDPRLVVAIQNANHQFIEGFFDLPLATISGEVTLTIVFSQDLAQGTFFLAFATIDDQGVVSQYTTFEQTPIQVATGTVQVSLSFQPSQDLDLHLVEPSGEEIFFGNLTSTAGGTLDLDSNPNCAIDGRNNENITYPEGTAPPSGEYIVRVDFFESCDQGGATFSVVVNKNGQQSTFTGQFSATDADAGGEGSGRQITRFTFP